MTEKSKPKSIDCTVSVVYVIVKMNHCYVNLWINVHDRNEIMSFTVGYFRRVCLLVSVVNYAKTAK